LNKDYKKIISIIKYLNVSLERIKSSFSSRLKLQKLAYICKALGINLNYKFSLYIRGPYSPGLTNDYYKNPRLIDSLDSDYNLNEKDIKVLDKIGDYILSHYINENHEIDLLESISTILYLSEKDPDKLDDELFADVKEIKPKISDYIIIIANNTVKKLLFKSEYLTDEIRKEIEMWDQAED